MSCGLAPDMVWAILMGVSSGCGQHLWACLVGVVMVPDGTLKKLEPMDAAARSRTIIFVL